MSTSIELEAELREDKGKGASRRLRHHGKVPAVLYGGGRDSRSITLDHNTLMKMARHESFFSQILTIRVGDVKQSAIVRDMQTHPAKSRITHLDLLRVMDDVEIRISVPLHFLNEETSVGVKEQAGQVAQLMHEIEIACLPKDLPEYLEVDIALLKLDEMLHMSDIKLPAGVEIPELAQGPEHDQPIVAINPAKKEEVDVEEDVAATPEVPVVGQPEED